MSESAVRTNEERLPFCPRCEYALTGLPAEHRCPECGLAFDADSRVWVPRRRRGIDIRDVNLLAFVCSLSASIGIAQIVLSGPPPANMGVVVIGVFNVFVAAFNLWTWYHRRFRTRPFLALMPDGVWFLAPLNRRRFLPWDRINSVEAYFGFGQRTLIIRRRTALPIHLRDVLDSTEQAEKVIALASVLTARDAASMPHARSDPAST